MNREQYYRLRHNMRASGWSWNGGNRLTKEDNVPWPKASMAIGVPKTETIGIVARTLKTLYEGPKVLAPEKETDSAGYMRLDLEWNQFKRRGLSRTRIGWQNYIRSNVRNDRQIFADQLTEW